MEIWEVATMRPFDFQWPHEGDDLAISAISWVSPPDAALESLCVATQRGLLVVVQQASAGVSDVFRESTKR